ncbi:MAG: SusC/RagA family TonB-linked outer membrane protein [Salinivirgaceae bacterium]|nr:SusC/RagA family TonB-linked outer membrane protein [Salinivirgaceae bacterium]
MKHKHNILVLSAAMAVAPFALSAQTETDEVQDSVYMVKTAFRSVAQNDLLGGVSVVNVEEMLKTNYTHGGLDNMEALANGWNGTSLWGMDADNNRGYLVLIDGIPRDIANVKPTEIAQITFIKGANALVLYGSRGAKGAILITTKRGQSREKLKIDVNVNAGLDVIKRLPEYLNAADYMTYYNMARLNDGKTITYSDELIDKTASGVNPYHYPDIDYFSSDYIKKTRSNEEVVLELSGGNKRARLYGNINAQTEGDFVTVADAKENRTNRISFRGNVDINFNDYISGHVDANATFSDARHRQYSASPSDNMTYWNMASTERPNFPNETAQLVPVSLIEDEEALELIKTSNNIYDGYFLAGKSDYSFKGTNDDGTNKRTPMGQIYAGGELVYTARQFQFDGGLDFNLSKVLDGLWLKTNFGMDFKTSYNTRFNPKYAVYFPKWSDDEKIIGLTQIGADEDNGQKSLYDTHDDRTLALSFQFDYNHSFDDHNVSVLALGNGFQQTISGTYHNRTNANLGFDVSYNFAHRYYATVAAAVAHSAKLAPGHRNALSPSVTLGWNLAKESFLDGSIFDDLTISASASILNEDWDLYTKNDNGTVKAEYFLYLGTWGNSGNYGWGDSRSGDMSKATGAENENIEMIKRKELSATLRTSLMDGLVKAEFTYFKNNMDGYLITKTRMWPSHMDGFTAPLNNDINGRQGFDFALNVNKQVSDFDISVGLVGTYYDTKVIKREQTDLDVELQPQRDREGRPIDAIFGYKNAGYYTADEAAEANDSKTVKVGGKVRAGDIKYQDLSEDGAGNGMLDEDDQVYLGKDGRFGAPFVMGVNLTVKYKNFTFYALGTGKYGANGQKNNAYYQLKNNDKYSVIAKDTWTEDNPNAKYPALSSGSAANNYVTSDFWMYKKNAFYLSKVQITYDFPQEMFGDSFVKGMSAFVSGKDLLTISKERDVLETVIGDTPKTRFFNIGVKATF